MQVGEHEGEMCMMRGCTQQDLLPSRCGKCRRVYCTAHLPYGAHKCAAHTDATVLLCPLCNGVVPQRAGEDPNIAVTRHMDAGCRDQPLPSTTGPTHQCSFGTCGKVQPVRMLCDRCGRNFCVSHRMPTQHRCEAKTPPPAPVGGAPAFRAVATPPKPKAKATGAAAAAAGAASSSDTAQFRNTPRTALGQRTDNAMTLRVFLDPSFRAQPFFLLVAPKMSIGRIVDDVCALCSIRNDNNKVIPDSEKLFMWASGPSSAEKETPAPLAMGAAAGTALADGETLLLLRGPELPAWAVQAAASVSGGSQPKPIPHAEALAASNTKPTCKLM